MPLENVLLKTLTATAFDIAVPYLREDQTIATLRYQQPQAYSHYPIHPDAPTQTATPELLTFNLKGPLTAIKYQMNKNGVTVEVLAHRFQTQLQDMPDELQTLVTQAGGFRAMMQQSSPFDFILPSGEVLKIAQVTDQVTVVLFVLVGKG